MRTPDQPRVTGVLAPYAAEFRVELSRLGYSPYAASEHMYLMAHLSRWLDGHDLCPAELGPSRIEQFLSDRRANGQTRWVTPRGLARLLGYLRGAGIVPEPPAVVPSGPADRLIAAFVGYLSDERGLAPGTIASHRHFAELFLSACTPDSTAEGCGLERLGPKQVNELILAESTRRSIGSTKNLAMALRVLMRFFFLEGYTPVCLVESVPRPIPWRDSGRSRALPPEQVRRLLASCDRRRATGQRDFAILTALARLGLRRGEVASLGLDDVDWRAGEIVVCGKSGPPGIDVGRFRDPIPGVVRAGGRVRWARV